METTETRRPVRGTRMRAYVRPFHEEPSGGIGQRGALDAPSGLQESRSEPPGTRYRHGIVWGIVLVCVMLGVVMWARGVGPEVAADGTSGRWSTVFLDMLRWIQARGMMAALWLVALQALIVILAIPGPFFTLGAGFLFGLAGGSLIAVAGSTVGAVAAYGIARGARVVSEARGARALSESRAGWFTCWMAAHPRLQAAERLMTHLMKHGDWKVVLSTRLIPLFPFKFSNYVFGWVRYPFAPFFWGTALGLVPITMVSVSVGALASDVSGLAHPDLTSGTSWIWSLAALAVGAGILIWTGTRARASLRTAEEGKGPHTGAKP